MAESVEEVDPDAGAGAGEATPRLLSEEPEWSDLTPIPQKEGVEPVVQILYDKEYSDAMGLLRAVMLKGELSARALHLTSLIIFMNSAHFTVWEFRRCVLGHLASRAKWMHELEFMQEINHMNTKNYQLWNHRRAVIQMLFPQPGQEQQQPRLAMDTLELYTLEDEFAYLAGVLAEDSKHYHCWAHRQWLVGAYERWRGEMDFTTGLLQSDVYNNSAWNHRFFVLSSGGVPLNGALFQHEVVFALNGLEDHRENESAWSFLTGLLFKLPHSFEECHGDKDGDANGDGDGDGGLSVSVEEYLQALEVLKKFVAVLRNGGKSKRKLGPTTTSSSSSSSNVVVHCVSFHASMCFQLALRVLGGQVGQERECRFWGALRAEAKKADSRVDPRAHLEQAAADWQALQETDPVRKPAYLLKWKSAKLALDNMP